MTKIVLASTNHGKVREFARLLAELPVELVSMADLVPAGFSVEESGDTFLENAWLKALAVCEATGLPALSDDSGLEVDALGGRPGVYSARFAGLGASDAQNNELLLRELDGVEANKRTARFVCCLAFAVPCPPDALPGPPDALPGPPDALPSSAAAVHRAPLKLAWSRGAVEGLILHRGRGTDGFGYDPIFEPLAFPGQTTAELSGEAKDRISHRGQATRDIVGPIQLWLEQSLPSRNL
jgi:XTP/dITP diphosphohydrolase